MLRIGAEFLLGIMARVLRNEQRIGKTITRARPLGSSRKPSCPSWWSGQGVQPRFAWEEFFFAQHDNLPP